MIHPFHWLTERPRLGHLFWGMFTATLLVLVGMQILGSELVNDVAPAGIVTFEFAGDVVTAQAIMSSWGKMGRIYAGLSLGLDFLFLVCYAITLSLGCVLVAQKLTSPTGVLVGTVLAWGQLAAGALDSVENMALIRILVGSSDPLWPQLAKACAGPKFILVLLGLGYIVGGAVYLLWKKWFGGSFFPSKGTSPGNH